MALPEVSGEFKIVKDPELIFLPSGKPKLRLRCLAKDRKRGDDGTWTDDGPALFIDVIVWAQAESLAESVTNGDGIIVIGKLKCNEWQDADGNKRTEQFIEAISVGPSVRWGVAKTIAAGATQPSGEVTRIAQALGATVVQDEIAPF